MTHVGASALNTRCRGIDWILVCFETQRKQNVRFRSLSNYAIFCDIRRCRQLPTVIELVLRLLGRFTVLNEGCEIEEIIFYKPCGDEPKTEIPIIVTVGLAAGIAQFLPWVANRIIKLDTAMAEAASANGRIPKLIFEALASFKLIEI